MANAVSDLILQSYPAIAKDLVGPLLEFLTIARETCGDSDQALVLFAIAIRTYEHGDFRRMPPEALASGPGAQPPSLGTNVRSLAESLGIPRETVRRRVQDLVEAGLVIRSGHEVMLSAQGITYLAPARQALAGFAARCFQIVNSLNSNPPPPSAAPAVRLEVCERPA